MRQRLTERSVKRKEQGEIWDELLPGFGIRIGARRRTFFVMGRVDGRQVRRTVGTTVDLTLAQAREKARAMLANFANGVDPESAKRAAKLEAARARLNSFAAVSEAYMAEHGQLLTSAKELKRKLGKDILPVLGHLPMADIQRADIKALFLEKARETPVAANRMLALIRVIFNYAVDEELVTASPAVRIKARPEKNRARYLGEAEIASFWNGLPETGTSESLQRALKFMLVVGQRPGEVLGLRWYEIDLAEATWTLPAGRTKSARASLVPLTDLAIELLGEPGDGYVFANGGGRRFARSSTSRTMQTYRSILGLTSRATPHDLRRTFATQLGALQIDRLIISKILNHVDAGITGTTYDLHDRLPQKRLALAAWSARLIEITTGTSAPSNVEPLRTAG